MSAEKAETWVEKQSATWIMLLCILIACGFAMVMCIIYGYLYSGRGALLAFLASLLGFAIGGISGFLFGFPRYSDPSSIQNLEDLKKALAQNDPKAAESRTSPIRQSTNLERITDWLMTMIVGATVVNLKDLTSWAHVQFESLTKAIVYSGTSSIPTDSVSSAAPGALVVLPFVVGGFLSLYLWARRYLPREWRNADEELYAKKVDALVEAQKVHEQQITKLETVTYRVDATLLKRFQESMARFGADSSVIDDVVARYRIANAYQEDPMKGFGKAESDEFKMSVQIREEKDNTDDPFSVDIAIERVDGQQFGAVVAMLYHNSFDTPIEFAPYVGERYSDQLWCEEPFTIGAVVVLDGSHKTIRLAVDLEKVSDAPANFKSKPEPRL